MIAVTLFLTYLISISYGDITGCFDNDLLSRRTITGRQVALDLKRGTKNDASGKYNRATKEGSLDFPDGTSRDFTYKPARGVIEFADGERWTKDSDVAGHYKHVTSDDNNPGAEIYRTKNNEIEVLWLNGRPTAYGDYNCPIRGNDFGQGAVTFPDDRKYVLRYYPDLGEIHWDGEQGETTNVWVKVPGVTEEEDEYEYFEQQLLNVNMGGLKAHPHSTIKGVHIVVMALIGLLVMAGFVYYYKRKGGDSKYVSGDDEATALLNNA